jgi:hypothetical protein
MIWILLLLVGVAMSLGNAWRLWFRRHPSEFEKWRGMVLFLGLLAASLSAFTYCAWLAYRVAAGDSPLVWRMKHSGGNVGTGLFLFALVASVVGRGPWRESLGAGAILGVLLWAEFGIL